MAAWQDKEREARVEAARRFWEEIQKTRQTDPDTGDPESLRKWGRRIGADINNLVQWSKGGSPSPRMIRRIVDKMRLPQSEFFRLFALSDPDCPPYTSVQTIPLYDALKTRVQKGGYVDGDVIGNIPLSPEIAKDSNASSRVIALQLPDDCDDSAPHIQPGAVVFVDMRIGRDEDTFLDGALYAVNDEYLDRIVLRVVREVRSQLYCDYLNRNYKGEPCWTADLGKLIVGRVFLAQSPIRRVA